MNTQPTSQRKSKRRAKQRWPFITRRVYPSGLVGWIVDPRIWDEKTGKLAGERKTFETLTEAETFAEQCRVRRGNEGLSSFSIPEDLRIEAGKCMEKLAPYGKTLSDAVAYYLPYLERTAKPKPISDLIGEAIEEKRRKGMQKPTIAEFACRCRQFAAAFPDREAGGIATEEIEAWLSRFEHPVTRNNSRKAIVNLFNFAVRKTYVPTNPAQSIHKQRQGDNEIEILTPEQISALLCHSTEEILPYFAIAAFAGIRPEELQKLEWEDVKWKAGIIRIRETVSNKTGARNVEINPTLAAWLAPYHHQKGRVCTPSWRRLFRATREAAGIEHWPDDVLRHSYATYSLETTKDAPRLALQMGNSVPVILDRYAKPLDEPADAAHFWALRPSSEASAKVVQMAA